MSHAIALIGAGVMGFAMGSRLLESDNSLWVYDPNAPKRAALAEKGAHMATSAAEAAAQADFVILSLNSDRIVEQAVFGEQGVASQAKAGTQIIDMSSIDPVATRELAQKAQEKGLRWLDCPLSGGAPKAVIGQLTVMAGGNEADFEASKVIMNQLCANYTLMGPTGAGQTTKLINQVLCALNFVAVAEATQLAQDAGVDATQIPKALKGGRADSAILQEFMGKMAAKDYSPSGRIDNMVKDLNSVQDLARSLNTAMPMTAACAEIHRLLTYAGWGKADTATLMEFYSGTLNKTVGRERRNQPENSAMNFRQAKTADLDKITRLLKTAGLPYEDCSQHLNHFVVLEQDQKIIGLGGIELYGTVALLRSIVVQQSYQGQGLGAAIFAKVKAYATEKNVKTLYLLTETAESYFAQQGFAAVSRDAVPVAIQQTAQFSSLCPASAVVMQCEIT